MFALHLLVPEHGDDADGTSCREEVCAIDTDCGPRLLVDGSHCGGFSVGEPELWGAGASGVAARTLCSRGSQAVTSLFPFANFAIQVNVKCHMHVGRRGAWSCAFTD